MGHYLEMTKERLFQSIRRAAAKYRFQRKRTSAKLSEAISSSTTDLLEDARLLFSKHSPENYPSILTKLYLNVVESGIWVGKTSAEHLLSTLTPPILDDHVQNNATQSAIIKAVARGRRCSYAPTDIFSAVLTELNFYHLDPFHKTKLKMPRSRCTIVLIPGVFNEIYRTAAFERGVKNVCAHYGMTYTVFRVDGHESPEHNARHLYQQLKTYIAEHPKEKLWFLAYSKGGVDVLKFLRRHRDVAQRHVVGLSTIASPIQGTPKADAFWPKLIPEKHINKGARSLSPKNQSLWFRKNHRDLPDIFYTSLSLESEWYRAHIWMMLAKLFLHSNRPNDGVVDSEYAQFPDYFRSHHLGTIQGHHLIGCRYSSFNQEALIEAHIITLNYLKLL